MNKIRINLVVVKVSDTVMNKTCNLAVDKMSKSAFEKMRN